VQDLDDGLYHLGIELQYAASQGDVEGLRQALAASAGKDVAKPAGLALRTAVSIMDFDAARFLIDAGADLDAGKSYEKRRGTTPLACAAESWHRRSKEMMRLLLDAGADVDGRDHRGRTPLIYAVLAAYRHGAPLRKAVPLLLDAGADVAAADELGFTAWALAKAPLVEEEERARLGHTVPAGAIPADTVLFDGPDLSDLFSDAANEADRRQSRLDRCREALELLQAAGAEPRCEAELRLLVAATAGDDARVAELLEAGADADAHGPDGDTAIAAAARGGHGKVVARLIAAGCKVDASKAGAPAALETAVRRGDAAMTRQLIDGGANVFMLIAMSREAMAAAEAAGFTEVVKMVRDALPPEAANFERDSAAEIAAEDLAYESQRALPGQAARGEADKVRELLAVPGVEVDGFDALRRTALMAAAEAGHLDLVRELIAAGADVNRCNGAVGSPRSTPLACAAICPSAERDAVLRLLLEAGADVDRLGADGRTALMHAVERDVGFFGRVGEPALSTRTLIEAGPDLEIRDPYGLTAWMRAGSLATATALEEVADGYRAIAGLLEDAGASIDGRPELDLIRAVVSEDVDEARALLAAGADPNARRFDGATALMLAVRDGHRDIVRLLLDAGCDADARQWIDRGPRAIAAAAAARDQATYQMLIAAGASPPDPVGRRPDSPSPFLDE
jgi:ankyrin repeat protein